MSQEYELINYSEHGSVVDGVLYSCDFSDKSTSSSSCSPSTSASNSSVSLTLDDITELGSGRKAEKARERLSHARKSLEDKREAKRALEAALKLAIPASVLDESYLAEEMSKVDGLVTRMGLKRVAAETSVVSIPLSKTRKIDSTLEQKTNTLKLLTGALDKSKTNLALARNGTKKTTGTNNQLKINNRTHLRAPNNQSTHTPPPQGIKKEVKKAPLSLPRQASDGKNTEPTSISTAAALLPKKPIVPCLCKRSASSVVGTSGKGWEGTATLYHGSKLRFGCIQFVLSLAGRPGHAELVDGLSKVSNSTLSILNNSDQSRLSGNN